MEFLPQESVRLYLHPSGSRRLALLMRDFSLLLLELSTERHLAQRGAATASLAEEIEVYGDDLAEKHGMEGLLTAIAPGLKRGKTS